MKERPILFSAPMVRALLAGRKTVTRRVVKPQPRSIRATTKESPNAPVELPILGDPTKEPFRPGDRLWVRETWGVTLDVALDQARYGATNAARAKVRYAADGVAKERLGVERWRPSIHMPRWASRLTLEVTGVRVERLQAITEEDAVAEGVERAPGRDVPAAMGGGVETWRDYRDDDAWCTSACASFASLWQSLNGAGSWAANPWVWVVAFRVMTP